MSRVAKQPITIPEGVKVELNDNLVSVSGKNGSMEFELVKDVTVDISENEVLVSYGDYQESVAMGGTTRAILNNMVVGVSQGFEKKLELVGVGYRAKASGKTLDLTLGFSHPIKYELPESVSAETPSQTEIVLKSHDKQVLGQVASEIRAFRPPEPYKGKGVKYSDERIKRKEAKKSGRWCLMSIKNESRLRRAKKTRMRIKSQDLPRLTVFKSSQHIYAQIIDSSGAKVLAATSTLDKSIKSKGRSVQSAKEVGEKIADLSIKNGIKKVIFDRSGYRYHGRIKMIAEAAREKGLEI